MNIIRFMNFRMVPGKNHTNLIFDVLIPANDQISHQILKNKISAEVKQISDEYHCVIEIDHALFKEEKSSFYLL